MFRSTVIVFAVLMTGMVALARAGGSILGAKHQLLRQGQFRLWMNQHRKTYNADEMQSRYRQWASNLDFIENWNREVDLRNGSEHEVRLAMNHLGDLSREEYRKYHLGLKGDATTQSARRVPDAVAESQSDFDNGYDAEELMAALDDDAATTNQPSAASSTSPSSSSSAPLPTYFDWRMVPGAMTTPKAQLWCGGCYAFSATAAVETCTFRKTGKLVSLSEQNLIDCTWNYGNEGCYGGLMTNAYDYMLKSGGVNSEATYPYRAGEGRCRFQSSAIAATIKRYINLREGDEVALQRAVLQNPVNIGIDADPMSFQFYQTGVYADPRCSSVDLNHGVTLVGYGETDDGQQYWIVRNSWGPLWGEGGHIRFAKPGNTCGVASLATLVIC